MAPHCCVSQAFRRRFAGVSQCFADVSRMFRGRFAGCFARFARVSRMFRQNSQRLRAVNPCSIPAAHRVLLDRLRRLRGAKPEHLRAPHTRK